MSLPHLTLIDSNHQSHRLPDSPEGLYFLQISAMRKG